MEARLEHDFMRQVWRVWLFDHGGPRGTRRILQMPYAQAGDPVSSYMTARPPGYVELSEGTVEPIPPTFEIPEGWLKALVEAGSEVAPPDRAQGRHLDDAVKVRDRLLSLVEMRWPRG